MSTHKLDLPSWQRWDPVVDKCWWSCQDTVEQNLVKIITSDSELQQMIAGGSGSEEFKFDVICKLRDLFTFPDEMMKSEEWFQSIQNLRSACSEIGPCACLGYMSESAQKYAWNADSDLKPAAGTVSEGTCEWDRVCDFVRVVFISRVQRLLRGIPIVKNFSTNFESDRADSYFKLTIVIVL